MGAVDFVIGILVGILLACVSFVLQTSQVSAIRGSLPGSVANSTVRRHAIQNRFLQEAGRQIYVMKLAGYLFFGTIVGVETKIRELLADSFQIQSIRFLVLDLHSVDGIDFSAAEAFTRINRILKSKDILMIICGNSMDGDIGRSLCNVGLFDTENREEEVQYFASLNSALEYCENYLLKSFYDRQRDALTGTTASSDIVCKRSATFGFRWKTKGTIDVPAKFPSLPGNIQSHSPRRHELHRMATVALDEQDHVPLRRWQEYRQPLQLILQTFSSVSNKPEDFWKRLVPFLVRQEYLAGTTLYKRGDRPNGFYLLEVGMLKAEYRLQQGTLSELILAGTTCGELPFFSGTNRTSTTKADTDCVTWMLNEENWEKLQNREGDVTRELLQISLKLTSERMDSITK